MSHRGVQNTNRPWCVKFSLAYDGGGLSEWTQYYRTKTGARISARWHYHIASWGGHFTLIDNRKWET